MKKINYFSQSIKDFEKNGSIAVNEPPLSAHFYVEYGEYPELEPYLEKLRKEHNALPYAVIRSYTSIGTMDSILFVEDYEEEWEYFDVDAKYGNYMSYTVNYYMPDCSEFGSVVLEPTIAGGLKRVG